ncbi:hypothetical protein ACFYTG_08750 [Streptomyces mirabilis]|uniref:hypothetical protein n=1 Tax=Streptomyces mirabilis TaxID=68239 RepID=UPI0036858D13
MGCALEGPACRGRTARRTTAHPRPGLARLAWVQVAQDGEHRTHEFVIHGYGPAATELATRMAEQVQRLDREHRVAGYPRLRAVPRSLTGSYPTEGSSVLKEHVRLDFTWPSTTEGTAP